jgi:hypothetical protein
VVRRALTTQEKRDAGASLYTIERCKLFSRFRFGEFLFELVDPVLQRRQARVEQADIEKCHVIGGRIKGIAVAQPRRIVNLDVCEAHMLKHARGLRRARATLAVDNGFLARIEP